MAFKTRPFLSIPNEIRERIYDYVLTVNVDDGNPWVTPLNNALRPEPKKSSCLAILATCRQILFEAFHIFYGSNAFNFNHPDHVCDFLTSVGSVRASEIRFVRCSFRLAAGDNTAARHALSRLMKLENLAFQWDKKKLDDDLIVDWRDFIVPDFCSAREFTKLNGVREVNFIMMNDTEPSPADKERMARYRYRMTKPSPNRPKILPKMVDLFVGLKMRKQRDSAAARIKKKREDDVAYMKTLIEAHRKSQLRVKLEMLWRRGQEARRERDPFNVDEDTDLEDDQLANFFSSEPWIRDAILG